MTDVPPPPPPGAAPAAEAPPPPPRSRRTSPNYLVRRAIAVAVIVALIASIAIVVGWYLGRDDGEHDPVNVDSDWDVVAVLDRTSGTLTMTDPDDGEVVEEISTDVGRVRDSLLVDTTLVVTGSRGQVAVDLGADTGPVDLDPDGTLIGSVDLLRPEGSDRTALLADDSGNVVMVHEGPADPIATSELIEVPRARLDATAARATPDGRAVLFPDVGNFQSVLIDVDRADPVYFPGVPLAVDDDRVATVLNVGTEARVTISSHDGEVRSEFATDTIAGAMLIEDGLLTVSTDGDVSRVVDGESERVGSLSGVPNAGQSWVMISGDRLVIATDLGTDVLDADGTIVASVMEARPFTDGPEPWSANAHHALCLATTGPDGLHLVDARSDETSRPATVDGDLFVRADGCRGLVADGGAAHIIAVDADDDGAAFELAGDPLALSPDGATAAVEDGASVVLVPAQPAEDGDDPAEPVVVGEAGSIVYFAPT